MDREEIPSRSDAARSAERRTTMVEATLRREALNSELARVRLLIALLGLLLAVLAVLRSVPSIINGSLRSQLLTAIPAFSVVTAVYLGYEVSAYLWLKKLLRAERSRAQDLLQSEFHRKARSIVSTVAALLDPELVAATRAASDNRTPNTEGSSYNYRKFEITTDAKMFG